MPRIRIILLRGQPLHRDARRNSPGERIKISDKQVGPQPELLAIRIAPVTGDHKVSVTSRRYRSRLSAGYDQTAVFHPMFLLLRRLFAALRSISRRLDVTLTPAAIPSTNDAVRPP